MSSFHRAQRRNRRPSGFARLAGIVIGIGLALVVLWLAISAVRLANAGRSLLEQQRQLESLLAAGILNADSSELEQVAVTVRDDIVVIRNVAGPFTAAGRYLGWLPVIGPLAADGEELLGMADAGSEMALYALSALRPVLSLDHSPDGQTTDTLPDIITALNAGKPGLARADQAAGRLFEYRAALKNSGHYPAQITELLGRLDDNAALIQDGLKLALIAPELLGADRPRTYLILAQNEDELRPTGGFISGAGVLTVYQGQITSLNFENANLVDDWQHKPYDLPPAPFTEFMGMDIFLFRDANFWPDFPISASKAMDLYTYGQDVPLDGVLAFDQQFLQQLLATMGPLPVPELDRVVDAQSVVTQLRQEWGPGSDVADWVKQRKAFMGPLANAFRNQLDSGVLSAKGYELIQTLESAALERHLQLYLADPEVAEILDQTAWSGRLAPTANHDFLHVADTNMGFNKVNAVVDRSIIYEVELDDELGSTASLQLRYENPAAPEDIDCRHGTQYAPDTQYESLTIDCYWSYVRVYVPAGSELLSASEHPLAAEALMSGAAWPGLSRVTSAENEPFTMFDNFILLGPGQEISAEFQYALPDSVLLEQDGRYRYQLDLRKQAGTASPPAQIRITIPDGARLLNVSPQPATIYGNSLVFDEPLVRDLEVSVEYSR